MKIGIKSKMIKINNNQSKINNNKIGVIQKQNLKITQNKYFQKVYQFHSLISKMTKTKLQTKI